MTKQTKLDYTRAIYEEAHKLDPHYLDEAVQAIFGSSVFVWSNATMQQLAALSRAALLIRLSASD